MLGVSPSSSVAAQPPSAPPPSRAEIERKLSFKSSVVRPEIQRRPTRPPVPIPSSSTDSTSTTSTATPIAVSASAPRPSNLPPLVISPGSIFGGHFTNSPMASPATPHGGLSSIAESERQSSGRISPVDDVTEGGGEGDDSEEGEGASAELERGAEIKSGFLIKKQERRKLWKKKWFVLRPTRIAYYKDNREYSLSRAIDLKQIHSVVPVHSENQKHPFAFAIVTSARTFMLEALSAEERNDWIRVINTGRKRLSDRDEDEARRRELKSAEARTNPVPVPAPQSLGTGGEIETHPGTWTSTVSGVSGQTNMSVSPTNVPGGYFPRGASAGQPPSLGTSPGLPHQMGGLALGRSPSITATAPSAATVNRRLSNPIIPGPIPGLHPPSARTGLHREVSQGSIDLTAAGASTLCPPGQGNNYFVSSDEDEPYFSDPRQGWPADNGAVATPSTEATPATSDIDPNKVILATYLMKKSRKATREVWRKRWFFLTSTTITYTKSHMDARPLTTIPLHAVLDVFSVESGDTDDEEAVSAAGEAKHHRPHRHTSLRSSGKRDVSGASTGTEQHIIRIVTNKRRYDLCAPSEEEEIKWLAAIRALINRERERQAPNASISSNAPERTTPPKPQLAIPTIAQQPPTPSSLPPASPTPGSQAQAPQPPSPSKVTDYMDPAAPRSTFVPGHGRTRSATQTAKNAVADVVRRFATESAH